MQLAEHGTLFARRRVKAYAVSLVGLATLGLIGLAAGLTLRTGGWIVIALASILVLLLAALAAQARGRVCEWALADALFSDRTGHRYPLSIMTRSTRHIICATEIQTGQAMWFTAKGAVSRAFTLSHEPGDLSRHVPCRPRPACQSPFRRAGFEHSPPGYSKRTGLAAPVCRPAPSWWTVACETTSASMSSSPGGRRSGR